MQYTRISLMTPRDGQAHEVTRLLSQVIAFCSQQPGFLGGLIVGGRPGAARVVGRITLWTDQASADRTAVSAHMLALRSRLDALVEEDTHQEHALDAVSLSAEPGGPAGLGPTEVIAIAEGFLRSQRQVTS